MASTRYLKLLDEIAADLKSYGGKLQAPCPSGKLTALKQRAKKELGVDLPPEYIDFLQLHDGLDWNGIAVYASERAPIPGFDDSFVNEIVEMNLVRREFPFWKNHLILGSTGDEELCFEIAKKRWLLIDAAATDVLETYKSFDALLSHTIQDGM